MKDRNCFSVKFVDMHIFKNTTLINISWESMKERSRLSVNFVNVHLLINNTLANTFRQSMKERNPLTVNVVVHGNMVFGLQINPFYHYPSNYCEKDLYIHCHAAAATEHK